MNRCFSKVGQKISKISMSMQTMNTEVDMLNIQIMQKCRHPPSLDVGRTQTSKNLLRTGKR